MNLRILYKKLANRKHTLGYKFILSIFFGLFGFVSYGYCTNVSDLIQKVCPVGQPNCEYYTEAVNVGTSYTTIIDFGSNLYNGKTICMRLYDWSITNQVSDIAIGRVSGSGNPYLPSYYANNFPGENFVCIASNRYLKAKVNAGASPISFKIEMFVLNDLLDTALPNMTSLECQTEYNLIPISSVDENYCVNNNLCPTNECTGGLSTLYINDIRHESMPFVYVNIPEEIERDYYTGINDFTIDVEGYGYDQEKMQQMVNTQYYKPTAEEMSGLMEKVADFLPLIAVALLITRIRRVIKKVF